MFEQLEAPVLKAEATDEIRFATFARTTKPVALNGLNRSRADRTRWSSHTFRCTKCGYGIAVATSALPICPMCHAESWRAEKRKDTHD